MNWEPWSVLNNSISALPDLVRYPRQRHGAQHMTAHLHRRAFCVIFQTLDSCSFSINLSAIFKAAIRRVSSVRCDLPCLLRSIFSHFCSVDIKAQRASVNSLCLSDLPTYSNRFKRFAILSEAQDFVLIAFVVAINAQWDWVNIHSSIHLRSFFLQYNFVKAIKSTKFSLK